MITTANAQSEDVIGPDGQEYDSSNTMGYGTVVAGNYADPDYSPSDIAATVGIIFLIIAIIIFTIYNIISYQKRKKHRFGLEGKYKLASDKRYRRKKRRR